MAGIRGRIARRKAMPKKRGPVFNALDGKIHTKSTRKIGPVRVEKGARYDAKGNFVSGWRKTTRPSLRKPGQKVSKTTVKAKTPSGKTKKVIKKSPGKKAYETRVKTKTVKRTSKTKR